MEAFHSILRKTATEPSLSLIPSRTSVNPGWSIAIVDCILRALLLSPREVLLEKQPFWLFRWL